jgi:hypothetical protein
VGLLPPDIDTAHCIDTRKAGFTPAFLLGGVRGERASTGFFGQRKKISRCMQLFVTIRYYGSGRLVGQRTCVLLR